ncbi:MAG: 3-oxoacyl-ACP reductase [Bradymonadaceae bacterium]
MNDVLMQIAERPLARRMIDKAGLPIPLPQPLDRESGPRRTRPLANERIGVFSTRPNGLMRRAARTILDAGAEIALNLGTGRVPELAEHAESRGHPLTRLDIEHPAEDDYFDALVLDADSIRSTEDLEQLYDFFHPLIGSLCRHGRLIVLARPNDETDDPRECAVRRSLVGFVRSLAKEVGRNGSTAQLIRVAEDADDRLAGPLRFFLSDRSAYISGREIAVDTTTGMHPEAGTWLNSLDGRAALVTGAAGGIGRATARALAAEGADVLCVDLPGAEGLEELADEIDGHHVGIDITSSDAGRKIGIALRELADELDVVVHNAGITRDRTLKKMERSSWSDVIDVNLRAPMELTEDFLETGLLADYGRVICLSSLAGFAGNVGQTNYSASKAGLLGYVEGLADQLADRGITVNALAPGFIETQMTAEMPTAVREVARRLNALNQGGQPEDVAQAVSFLATPGAQGVTGQALRVCGAALPGA